MAYSFSLWVGHSFRLRSKQALSDAFDFALKRLPSVAIWADEDSKKINNKNHVFCLYKYLQIHAQDPRGKRKKHHLK